MVFVDDFLGTGSQFLKSWRREYDLSDGSVRSFDSLAGSTPEMYYIPYGVYGTRRFHPGAGLPGCEGLDRAPLTRNL